MPVTVLDRTRTTVLDTGRFSTLDNQVDVTTGTVRAKARFANTKEALFPNQFVNVRLLLQTLKDVVVVPVGAMRNSSSGEFVYVLDEATRTVKQRPVKRGAATDDRIVIAQGLQAGEKVITEGADRAEGRRTRDAAGRCAGGGRGRRPARRPRCGFWRVGRMGRASCGLGRG